MKRFLLAIFLMMSFAGFGFAQGYNFSADNQHVYVSARSPEYVRFYDINPTEITARYNKLSENAERQLSGQSKDTYKKVKKIQKYIAEGNFDKALKVDNDFLPTHIQYYNYHLRKNDYHSAMNEIISIKRVNSMDKILNDDIISYKLGMLYYIDKNYQGALTYLSHYTDSHNPSEDNLWYVLSDIYFHLGSYDDSIKYAVKIPKTSVNYSQAQEILFNDYYSINNVQEAYRCAKELVSRNPNAHNYIRLAATSNDNDKTKLEILNKARNMALQSEDYDNLLRADIGIARLEQKKIDGAVSNLSGFIEKPDWNKIYNEVSHLTEPLELSQRQANFFKSTNYCIDRYAGQDLIKCFEYVNKEEAKISNEKLTQYQQEMLEQQQELDAIRMQQQFLEQTYYQRMYLDDFLYMRQPYPYFYENYW